MGQITIVSNINENCDLNFPRSCRSMSFYFPLINPTNHQPGTVSPRTDTVYQSKLNPIKDY